VGQHKNLFLDDEAADNSHIVRRKLAAANPFDASDLIEKAKQNGPPKSKIRVVKRQRMASSTVTTRSTVKAELEPDPTILMPPPPPPPPSQPLQQQQKEQQQQQQQLQQQLPQQPPATVPTPSCSIRFALGISVTPSLSFTIAPVDLTVSNPLAPSTSVTSTTSSAAVINVDTSRPLAVQMRSILPVKKRAKMAAAAAAEAEEEENMRAKRMRMSEGGE
jgi:hypothetical protein